MYGRIKNDILGKDYSLSVALVSSSKSRAINNKYRKKDKPANVLAFPYSKSEGEILVCPDIVKKEARERNEDYRRLLLSLVIHGMLHLKGMLHGSRMDKAEKKYGKKYLDRNRSGLGNNPGRGGGVSGRRKNS